MHLLSASGVLPGGARSILGAAGTAPTAHFTDSETETPGPEDGPSQGRAATAGPLLLPQEPGAWAAPQGDWSQGWSPEAGHPRHSVLLLANSSTTH